MSSVQQGSSEGSRRASKPTHNRRSWSFREEEILIAALRDLIAQGWKSDNGFRPGYLNKLEEAIKKEFPSSDLKANPHINSKLTTWKKSYNSLTLIMNRSGVGFCSRGTYMIECEDETWDQIVRADPNARTMRYKSWPYYEVWKEIFGKDRATGEAAEDILEALNDIMEETSSRHGATEADFGVGESAPPEDTIPVPDETDNSESHSQLPSGRQNYRGRKRRVSSDIQEVCKVLDRIGRNADARIASLAGRLGYEFDVAKQKREAFQKLESMNFLSVEQRIEACEILSKQVDKLEVFRGLLDGMVRVYVEHLLKK